MTITIKKNEMIDETYNSFNWKEVGDTYQFEFRHKNKNHVGILEMLIDKDPNMRLVYNDMKRRRIIK